LRPWAAGATIPFSFIVNGRTLPPGTYTVTSERTVLLVRGYGLGAAVVTNRVESRQDGDPSIIFHKYGDRHILVQAWMGRGVGRVVPTSSLERERIDSARRGGGARAFERIVIPTR
jgi:hypothetical protein